MHNNMCLEIAFESYSICVCMRALDSSVDVVGDLCPQMFDAHESPTNSEEVEETRKETKHAPDLLEGPNINEEGTKPAPCNW